MAFWTAAIWWSTGSRTPRVRISAGASEERRDARASYERALALTRQEPERRFLERRLAELADA